MTSVAWYSSNPDVAPRLYWDQGMLQSIVAGSWRPAGTHCVHELDVAAPIMWSDERPDVVILPGRFHADRVAQVNADLSLLEHVLVIITSDEESTFPWWDLRHPSLRLWVQTPKIEHMTAQPGEVWPERWLPEGAPFDLYSHMGGHHREAADRALDWWFGGQITHSRRHDMVRAMRRVPGGAIAGTKTFGAGLELPTYLRMMATAKIVPCPGGPVTPDSFRLYEALEAGCVPIADTLAGNGSGAGFYRHLFPGGVPFPVLEDWKAAPLIVEEVLSTWGLRANLCGAWWAQQKRDVAHGLHAGHHRPTQPADHVTVLVSMSPVRSHPSLAMLEATVASIREQLDDVEILVMCDGVRPEQQHLAADYDEAVRRLVWACAHDPAWHNVCPVVAPQHRHQGLMTRETLPLVHTPLILFVEHDTPLLGSIDWAGLVKLARGPFDVVRLYHEGAVPAEHVGLHQPREDFGGVPIMRTSQWSQRPHLAKTSCYRRLCSRYFGQSSRTMIEDVMHGVVATNPQAWPIAIYAPAGDMRRSGHSDGRGADPKFPMVYGYDTKTPAGAPRATAERVD